MSEFGQLTYASLAALEERSGGWQVRQTSPGLTADQLELMTAQVCTSIDPPAPLPRFPTPEQVTLRPRRLTFRGRSGAGVWCHAVPAGPDASGRDGNVFSHVLLRDSWGWARSGPDVGRPIDWWTAGWLAPFGAREVETARFDPDEPPNPEDPGALRESVMDLVFELVGSPRETLLRAWLDAVRTALDRAEPIRSAWPSSAEAGRPHEHRTREDGPSTVVLALEDPREAARWIGLASYLTSPQVSRRLSFSTFDRLRDVLRRGGGGSGRASNPLLLRVVPRQDLAGATADQLERMIVLDEFAPPRLTRIGDGDAWTSVLGAAFRCSPWGVAAAELATLGRDHATDLLMSLDLEALGHWDVGADEVAEMALQRAIHPDLYPWPEPESVEAPVPTGTVPKTAPAPPPPPSPPRDPLHTLHPRLPDSSTDPDTPAARVEEHGPLVIERSTNSFNAVGPDEGSRLPDAGDGSVLEPSRPRSASARREGPDSGLVDDTLDWLAAVLSDTELLLAGSHARRPPLRPSDRLDDDDVHQITATLLAGVQRLVDGLEPGRPDSDGRQVHPALVVLATADLVTRVWVAQPNSPAHRLWPMDPRRVQSELFTHAVQMLDEPIDRVRLESMIASLDPHLLSDELESVLRKETDQRGAPPLDNLGQWPALLLWKALLKHKTTLPRIHKQLEAELGLAELLETGQPSNTPHRVGRLAAALIAYHHAPGATIDWWRGLADRVWGAVADAGALPAEVQEEFVTALLTARNAHQPKDPEENRPHGVVTVPTLAWWTRVIPIRNADSRRRCADDLLGLLQSDPAREWKTLKQGAQDTLRLIRRGTPAPDPEAERMAVSGILHLTGDAVVAAALAPWLVMAALRSSTESLHPDRDTSLADALRHGLGRLSYQQLAGDPETADAIRLALAETYPLQGRTAVRDEEVWNAVRRHPYVQSGAATAAGDPLFATIGAGPWRAGTTVAALALQASQVPPGHRLAEIRGSLPDRASEARLAEFLPASEPPPIDLTDMTSPVSRSDHDG